MAWLTPAELAGLPGLPKTRRGVHQLASRQEWVSRERQARGGGREYHISNLPAAARHAVALREIHEVEAPADGEAASAEVIELPRDHSRADARVAVIRLLHRYRKLAELSATASRAPFAAAFNDGSIKVEDWVKAAVKSVSAPTLKRWESQLRKRGPGGLRGQHGHRKGSGIIDNWPALRQLIIGMIVGHPHCTAKHVMRAIRARFDGGDRALPAYRSVQRWMTAWRAENAQAHLAIANPDAHRSRYQVAGGRADEHVLRLNQLWEMDSTPADVMLVDGRHAIIGCIDVYSRRARMLVTPTSKAVAIGNCLRNAMLAFGVPETVRTDEGSDYVSHHMSRVLADLAIRHDECPPFTPEMKPFIERFFGTFARDIVELLPGYIGHNVAERQAIEARRSFAERLGKRGDVVDVSLTAAELQEICDRWCDDIYGRDGHGGLAGKSPFQVAAGWPHPVRRIEDERALDLLLSEAPGGGSTRKVGKKGIRLEGAMFIAPELGEFVGRRVEVRLDAADIGRVYLFDADDGRFLCVAECPERTGVSRKELAVHMKARQRQFIKEQRRQLRATAKAADIDDIAREILDAARDASNVAAFPRRDDTHDTPALAEAGRAARADDPKVFDDLTPEQDAWARAKFEELEGKADAVAAAENVVPLETNGRPEFVHGDDRVYGLWLIDHLDQLTEYDREFLLRRLPQVTFRLLLEIDEEKAAELIATIKGSAADTKEG